MPYETSKIGLNAENINYRIRLMEGSNHFQMRNDDNTEWAMEFIYDQGMTDDTNEPTFFTTDRK